jgi:hypothetical protein
MRDWLETGDPPTDWKWVSDHTPSSASRGQSVRPLFPRRVYSWRFMRASPNDRAVTPAGRAGAALARWVMRSNGGRRTRRGTIRSSRIRRRPTRNEPTRPRLLSDRDGNEARSGCPIPFSEKAREYDSRASWIRSAAPRVGSHRAQRCAASAPRLLLGLRAYLRRTPDRRLIRTPSPRVGSGRNAAMQPTARDRH